MTTTQATSLAPHQARMRTELTARLAAHRQWLDLDAASDPAAAAMPEVTIAVDDPRASDIRALVARHLEFAASHKPPEDIHALDVAGLLDPAVTVFSCRAGGALLAVGALKRLGARHAELKSMHTAEAARGRGIGRAMLAHLIGVARDRGIRCLSLKTGSQPAFAPARSLYAGAGFTPCAPFSNYRPSPGSTFLTLSLDRPAPAAPPCRREAPLPARRRDPVQLPRSRPAGINRGPHQRRKSHASRRSPL